jgi:hypothetical protein
MRSATLRHAVAAADRRVWAGNCRIDLLESVGHRNMPGVDNGGRMLFGGRELLSGNLIQTPDLGKSGKTPVYNSIYVNHLRKIYHVIS